jgi:hypothetical protein
MTYNKLTNSNYKSVLQLIYNPPKFKKEVDLRAKIAQNLYDLFTVLVVDYAQIFTSYFL